MKATINNNVYEGTPEEICRFLQLLEATKVEKTEAYTSLNAGLLLCKVNQAE